VWAAVLDVEQLQNRTGRLEPAVQPRRGRHAPFGLYRTFWYNEAVSGGTCELLALVAEADRIRAAAPSAPGRAELLRARNLALHALARRERIVGHVALVEEALRRPVSWLRPVQRIRLLGQARARRSAEATARYEAERAQARFRQLREQAGQRRDYLITHQRALAAGRSARIALEKEA
jgi:hypothetical protein